MSKVFFATRVRGFFKHLFNNRSINYQFMYNEIYEVNSRKRVALSKIARWRLFDWLGVIQVIECTNKGSDINGSFNRFLTSDKPYFIYLENPTALYHYRLERNNSWLGRRKIANLLNDENLKAIVCMSDACYSTFNEVCGNLNEKKVMKKVIYPYVPHNPLVTENSIKNRCKKGELNLLFIAQGTRFISKGALEVIEAYKILYSKSKNINLTMITSIKDLDKSLINKLKEVPNIKLLDFNLSWEEMEKLYANSNVLLQPTSDESFGMTILEGMKAGLPVIATKLYAIPEMVKDGVNGYITEPKWWFFDKNNIPNPNVWNNRKKTIHSRNVDNNLAQFIYEKIDILNKDRELLEEMSMQSFHISNSPPFSEASITDSWNSLLNTIDN